MFGRALAAAVCRPLVSFLVSFDPHRGRVVMPTVPRWPRDWRPSLGQASRPRLTWGWSAPGVLAWTFSSSAKTPSPGVYWYVEHVSIIATIPLAIAGFGFTLWQIRKARTAAEAARDAARDAQRGIGRGTLLLLIPQLYRTEEELERAIGDGQPGLMLSWLAIWRWQASQLRGLLKVTAPDERGILKAIQKSMVATADLKTEMLGIKSNDLVDATKEVRTTIAAVTNGLGELAMVQGMQIGQIDG
jgi:hypothetical protein